MAYVYVAYRVIYNPISYIVVEALCYTLEGRWFETQ
jgi:hypothetical protein